MGSKELGQGHLALDPVETIRGFLHGQSVNVVPELEDSPAGPIAEVVSSRFLRSGGYDAPEGTLVPVPITPPGPLPGSGDVRGVALSGSLGDCLIKASVVAQAGRKSEQTAKEEK